MKSILNEIFDHKRLEIENNMAKISPGALEELAKNMPKPLDFRASLIENSKSRPALIAEIKRKSPSKGILSHNFNPTRLAETYATNGAAAISVLTDSKYFGGSLNDLKAVNRFLMEKNLVIPTLRKDFIFSEYQLFEAKLAGASAVLLIAAMLSASELAYLIDKAQILGLTSLIEVHNAAEVKTAINVGAQIIGINNRDLHSFKVDINTSLRLRALIPESIPTIAESGIKTAREISQLWEAGITGILVGESLVTSQDPARMTAVLAGKS